MFVIFKKKTNNHILQNYFHFKLRIRRAHIHKNPNIYKAARTSAYWF